MGFNDGGSALAGRAGARPAAGSTRRGSALAAESGAGGATLLGRRSECEALDRLLIDVESGTSRVTVLRGDPGVGKSELLGYLSHRVAGWRVATAVGVESEMELAYSGLHQLCGPMLDHLDRLPIPQREALATVFGLGVGVAPDRFLVGLATLSLLADAAEQQPLVCIVDDAQWLDRASAEILSFVSRRLLAERIALVCAARTGVGDDVFAGLPELSVHGLGDSDARALLLDNVYGPLDAAVCDQIVSESHGNPLALLELPRTWRATDLAGGFGLPSSQLVASKIQQSYVRRLRQLPSDTQLLVLAAAAEPIGDRLLLHRAAETLDVDMAAAFPAVDAGLLHVGWRVEFAHPLVRSATYRAATVGDRRRAHLALAEATDAEADPDRRAWHRARATPGPDEEVAAELEHSAGRAQARGGVAAAAAFLTRATELTPDPTPRVQRALEAAFANVQAGTFDTARTLITTAGEGPLDESHRARIDLLRAQLAFASSRGTEAITLLLAAAQRLEPLDINLARETYLDAFSAALFGARLNDTIGVPEIASAARAAPRRPEHEPTAADLLLDGLVALTDNYETGVTPCRDALQKLSGDRSSPTERLRWLWQGCVVALELWDDDSAYLLSHRNVQIARDTGTLSELALALSARTPVLVFCGDLSAAAATVAETESVEEIASISSAPYGALILHAWRGDASETKELIEITTRDAAARGEGIGLAICEYAHAVLCNGLGQYEEAVTAARSASAYHEVIAENWGLSELVEPATRTGRSDLATDALNRLAHKAQVTRSDWALGIEARSRALMSEVGAAEGQFREAIERLSRTRVRAELARTHLLYGEWLRRANRRVDARGELNVAYELFSAMGMQSFAERTRRELLATGATVHRRSVEMRDELTAQEAQIARLARDGLSNAEIGAQLFISARTVEWHLRKVFNKLGISSRRQLGVAFADVTSPSPAPRNGSGARARTHQGSTRDFDGRD
jgi:DNA-binding CsgD family transcriptional regulator